MNKLTIYLPVVAIIFLACHEKNGSPQEEVREQRSTTVPEVAQLSRWIEQSPEQADLRYQRGALYYQLEQLDSAAKDLEEVIKRDTSWLDARHLLADIYLDNLQSRKALETMLETTRVFPDSIRSLLKLSEFQLILRRYSGALESLRKIQQIQPKNADAYFMKGMVLKETGDTTQAIAEFQRATRENPRLTDAWINLGQLHEGIKNPDAKRYFDAGLSISPNHPLILKAKAQFLARSGDLEAAKSIYHTLIELDPFSAEAYYDLGLLFLDQDSTLEAKDHFELSLKIDPVFARAYFYRGWTNELLDNLQAAHNDYEQVLRLEKGDPDAQQGLMRIHDKL